MILGIFKVKLFGILPSGKINMFYFMHKLEEIIKQNHQAIKIWNLSIDSENDAQGISLLGQYFDILQKKYEVLFVVSAGNTSGQISAGADSLSVLTVGSLYETDSNLLKVTSYSGSKTIFGRFIKPNTYEISNDFTVFDHSTSWKHSIDESGFRAINEGTSFSAPLTARKCCYLMNKYNLSIEAVKAVINLLSEVSIDKLPNIHFNDDLEQALVVIEGEALPKDNKVVEINLPTYEKKKDKLASDFTYAISSAYFVVPSNKLGDEYSAVNLEFKIVNHKLTGEKNDIFKAPKTSAVNGVNAIEVDLLKHFKKYDPNRVLVNKDFQSPFGYSMPNEAFEIKLNCSNLFDTKTTPVRYACALLLKEKSNGALRNFEKLNEKNIIREEVQEFEINIA